MDFQYTCRAVKYDPGDNFKIRLMFMFDLNVEAQVLNGFAHRLIEARFYLPMKPIDYVERNVGTFDHYTCGFPDHAHIQVTDKNNFTLYFKLSSIPGYLTERNLLELGVDDLRELLNEDITITALFSNHRYGQENNEEAGPIYVASIRKG